MLVNALKWYGLVMNPYNPCMANMKINGSQMTVVWHVNDFKVSHKDSFEVTKLGAYLHDIYRELKVNHGKLYYYLGMDLD